MRKAEQIKQLMEVIKEQEKRIFLLESVIKDFHNKMKSLLEMHNTQDKKIQTITATILQDKFNNTVPDDGL